MVCCQLGPNDTRWDNMRTEATTVLDGYLVPTYADFKKTKLSDEEIQNRLKESLKPNSRKPTDTVSLWHIRRFLWDRMGSHPDGPASPKPL